MVRKIVPRGPADATASAVVLFIARTGLHKNVAIQLAGILYVPTGILKFAKDKLKLEYLSIVKPLQNLQHATITPLL